MTAIDLKLSNEDIELTLQAYAELPDSGLSRSQVYTKAIAALIENADTEFWEKDPQELQAEEFWAEILEALVRHYAPTLDEQEPRRAHEWLSELVENLQSQGRLQEWLPSHDEDED